MKSEVIPQDLEKKYNTLCEVINGYQKIAIAFSGGVDSTFLLRVAFDQLQENTIAYFVNSQVQPASEKEAAISVARQIGCNFEIVDVDLFTFDTFLQNPPDRCYHCKKMIFSTLQEIASNNKYTILADGSNVDDQYEHRPGAKAIKELGVKSPLLEAGLKKNDIRQLSRYLQLPTWKKPSASCLATRIPANHTITELDLQRVEKGEAYLHSLGYLGCRLRLKENTATIELAAGDIAKMCSNVDITQVKDFLATLGISKVFLDLSEREGLLA